MSGNRYQDEGWLREQYVEEGKTFREIADMVDVTSGAIGHWIDKYGIETPSRSELTAKAMEKRYGGEKYREGSWLREEYVEKERSMADIGSECGVDAATIYNWLREHGIETRNKSESNKVRYECYEARYKNEGWLRDQYNVKERSSVGIAEDCDTSHRTILNWLERYGIERRTEGEGSVLGSLSGEDHPHWNGGEYPYGEGWTNTKKERVRERDGRECVHCGRAEEAHLEEYGMKLHVHHITPAREIDDAEVRNAMDNLEAVCIPCHNQVEQFWPLRPQAAD